MPAKKRSAFFWPRQNSRCTSNDMEAPPSALSGQDMPPPYEEPNSRSAVSDGSSGKKWIGGAQSREPQQLPPNSYFKGPQPPPTARYILGLEDDTGNQRPICAPRVQLDTAPFEFELVCLRCWEGESECSCRSEKVDPTTAIPPSALSAVKKPYGQWPVPTPLIKGVGMQSTHLASAVIHAVWPVTCLGMIPIFSEDSLSVIRSRALERNPDAKCFLRILARHVSKVEGGECGCGCGERICAEVALQHGLYDRPEDLARATSTTYIVDGRPDRTWSVVQLSNGKSYITTKYGGLTEIESSFEEDFSLCQALAYLGWAHNQFRVPEKREALLSWDAILIIMLEATLARIPNIQLNLQGMQLRRLVETGNGSRVLMRSEGFGVGAGYMVMDLKHGGQNPQVGYGTDESIPSYRRFNIGDLDKRDMFRSSSEGAAPGPKTLVANLTASAGVGWSDVTLGMNAGYPCFKVEPEPDLPGRERALWFPGRPLRGQVCSGRCKRDGNVMAHGAGFCPPDEANDTTVYSLGRAETPYTVIAQYGYKHDKPMYFVGFNECTECTVLEVTRGSIVVAGLPEPFLVGGLAGK